MTPTPAANTTVLTVGHSNRTLVEFVSLLRQHDVSLVVDVRSKPYSRYVPHFSKKPLEQGLGRHDMRYAYMGGVLGGLLDSDYIQSDGKPDYDRRRGDSDFLHGMQQLLALLRAETAVLMCAEEDPNHCHRRMLLCPALRDLGVTVQHLRGSGVIQSNAGVGDNLDQLSLW